MTDDNAAGHIIRDDKPASEWALTYPLGSGRLGACVFGGAVRETVCLNHDLLWRNYMKSQTYGTAADMPEMKRLCSEGKWGEAGDVLLRTVPWTGQCLYIAPFVPACDLYLTMYHGDMDEGSYSRSLDLKRGVARVSYTSGGAHYTREYFCSYEEGLFILHIACDKPGRLSGEISLSRLNEPECETAGSSGFGTVSFEGCFEEGRRFAAAARIINRGGRLTGGKRTYGPEGSECTEKKFGLGYVFDRDRMFDPARGASACFDSCDEVTVAVALMTDTQTPGPCAACLERVTHFKKDYAAVLGAQVKFFSSFTGRTELSLGGKEDSGLTTPELLARDKQAGTVSPELAVKLFDMAKYLAVSSGLPQKSSEPAKSPINLQGLFCRDSRPAWDCDLHTDLNVEMCYWALPEAGLADLTEPLLAWAERLLPQARARAADLYGCAGASMNGCCSYDTLGGTDSVGAGWLGAGAWIAIVLWQSYEYTLDENYLERLFEVMKEYALFYTDILVKKDGVWTPPFGSSPEMPLLINGRTQYLSSASSADLELINEFFTDFIAAGRILDREGETADAADRLDALALPKIDSSGCLMEWSEPHEEGEPGHRHRSALIGLCPGELFSADKTPGYAEAACRLLKKRQEAGAAGSASFSYAWDCQILDRLGRGDEALSCLNKLMDIHLLDNLLIAANDPGGRGGLAWFPGVKVVQSEASLCLAGAIPEMFYQDAGGPVHILPALPEAFKSGSLTGIHGRGGLSCDISWDETGTVDVKLRPACAGEIKVVCPAVGRPSLTIFGQSVPAAGKAGVVVFNAVAGVVYELKFNRRL